MEAVGRQIARFSRGLTRSWRNSHAHALPISTQQRNYPIKQNPFPWLGHFNSHQPGNALPNGFSAIRGLQFTSEVTFGGNGVRPIHPNWAKLGQQSRGIRVKVRNGNLEQALSIMQKKMIASGMERLIKRTPTYHIKASEQRILARKRRARKARSEELAKKLRSILIRKVRGL